MNNKELLNKLDKVSDSLITENKDIEKGFKQGVLIAKEIVKNNSSLDDVKQRSEDCEHYDTIPTKRWVHECTKCGNLEVEKLDNINYKTKQ